MDSEDATPPSNTEEMEVESVELGYTPGPDAVDMTPKKDGKLWREVLEASEQGEGGMVICNGMEVKVHYKGMLVDGTVFDESDKRSAPFSFTIGQGSVIEGWDKGLLGLKRGERVRLICHPDVAYKNKAQEKIPANSTLIFEIDVIDYSPEDLTKKKTGNILRCTFKEGGSKYLNPNHGSMVEVRISGKYKDIVVYPERTAKFRLGEGCEQEIPHGVEKALYKFRSGEGSILYLKGLKYGIPVADYDKFGVPHDATLEFTVELLSHENSKEPWQLDGKEKLAISKELKEVGNKYFAKANHRVAFKNYKLIIDHLKAEALLVGDEEEERKKLLLAANLNMAICNLKLGKPTITVRNCDDALDLSLNNTKALFRRGSAYMELNLPEKAKEDFAKVLELEPSNTAVTQQLAMCEKKLKEHLKLEKKMYSKMFSRN